MEGVTYSSRPEDIRDRFWRTLPAFVLVLGGIGAVAGAGDYGLAGLVVGCFAGGAAGVALAFLTELARWDCFADGSVWLPRGWFLPRMEYQEKFKPAGSETEIRRVRCADQEAPRTCELHLRVGGGYGN